jgi:hypothetical protein
MLTYYDSDLDSSDGGEKNQKTSSNNLITSQTKKTIKKKHNNISKKFSLWQGSIVVIDLDGTLINKQYKAYDNAHKFLTNLKSLSHDVWLCLWSTGSIYHVQQAMEDYFSDIKFDEIKCGLKRNITGKPVTSVREQVTNINCFQGPTVIIDDLDENLSTSQYDIVKDVKKYYFTIKSTTQIDYMKLFKDLVSERTNWINHRLKKNLQI